MWPVLLWIRELDPHRIADFAELHVFSEDLATEFARHWLEVIGFI